MGGNWVACRIHRAPGRETSRCVELPFCWRSRSLLLRLRPRIRRGCYNNCPYHPPHEWMIDFPRLMGRAKIVQAQEEGIPLAERMGMQQDLMGRGCCKTSALANLAFQSRPLRVLMERATGIDRRWPMPTYQKRPSSTELRSRPPADANQERVVLFTTCFVEYSGGETARAACQLLEHNGIAVEAGQCRRWPTGLRRGRPACLGYKLRPVSRRYRAPRRRR